MNAALSRHIPGVGRVAGVPVGDYMLDDHEGEAAQARADRISDRFLSESSSLWALAGNLEWLWYSDTETQHDPDAVKALCLIRDGSDDAELGRLIRERAFKELRIECEQFIDDEDAEGDA